MKYYSENQNFPSAPNKLVEAIYVALREYDRFIFSVKMLPVVKSSIENVTASLNKQYKNCMPLTVKWENSNEGWRQKDTPKENPDWYLTLTNKSNSYWHVLSIKLAKEESDL